MEGDRYFRERQHLAAGPLRSFRDRLDPAIPRVAAGCYTIWDEAGRFIYAGMAGRGLTSAQIKAARNDSRARVTGLRDRLTAHRAGGRSGDQFCVYVFDRLVLGALSEADIAAAVNGTRKLDDDTREFIQARLAYRWVETDSGPEAAALEATLVRGLGGSLPLLNPRRPEET